MVKHLVKCIQWAISGKVPISINASTPCSSQLVLGCSWVKDIDMQSTAHVNSAWPSHRGQLQQVPAKLTDTSCNTLIYDVAVQVSVWLYRNKDQCRCMLFVYKVTYKNSQTGKET